jgi:hypothetical protein
LATGIAGDINMRLRQLASGLDHGIHRLVGRMPGSS